MLSLDELNRLGWKVNNAWAPDCVFKDGLYYFYFPVRSRIDKSWIIGVATSDKSQGPFENSRVVKDQTVLIDDDGQAYMHCRFKSEW